MSLGYISSGPSLLCLTTPAPDLLRQFAGNRILQGDQNSSTEDERAVGLRRSLTPAKGAPLFHNTAAAITMGLNFSRSDPTQHATLHSLILRHRRYSANRRSHMHM
jgi:hypothetical protein